MSRCQVLICVLLFAANSFAQGPYSPAVGESGCIAVNKDSSIIKAWANSCQISRGYQNALDTSLGRASVGDSSNAIGPAQSNGVVSLGDGGSATLRFEGKIVNGPGPDFAVFENGFDGHFLELAFVSVSSDGQNYFRFPSHSLSDTNQQVSSFDSLNTTMIHNLAGKFQAGYGVPFDLQELMSEPGLDINSIRFVKIEDVIGSLNDSIASRDSHGNKINDPFPTPFPSGGFDLDAVAAIHIVGTGLEENSTVRHDVYPNPCREKLNIKNIDASEYAIIDLKGRVIQKGIIHNGEINTSRLKSGMYVLSVSSSGFVSHHRFMVQ